MSKILFIGPYSPPVTGQQLAFKTIVDAFPEDRYILIDGTLYNWRALNTICVIVKSIWWLLFKTSVNTIYFTCSRSVAGSIRDIPMLLFAGLLNKKVVNHLHGADFKDFYYKTSGWYRFFLKKAYQNVESSIVLLKPMISEFDMFPAMRKPVVHNFYPKEFDGREVEKNEEIIVTFLSNIRQSKGILEFLEAAKSICEQRNEVKFQIAGAYISDHLMSADQIKNKVEDFLQSNYQLPIEFFGEIAPKLRHDLLSKSHFFVLPSYYPTEGFPLVIIEAMRCGNVIVTTKHNYLPAIITEDNGSLIDAENSEQIVESILSYIDDPKRTLRIQKHNVSEAKLKYSESRYVSAVKDLICT